MGACNQLESRLDLNRRLAQLVRALGRHPRGQQFESATAYHHLLAVTRRIASRKTSVI